MGGSCSAPCTAVVEPKLDYENGCYHRGSLVHNACDCEDAPWPSVGCHQCGGNHLARHCDQRGTPERWQTIPTIVNANWGGAPGSWQCQHCTAGWVKTRNHIAP